MAELRDAHALHEEYMEAARAYSAFTSQFWSNSIRPNPSLRPMRADNWAESVRLQKDRDAKHNAWIEAARASTE